MSRELHDTVVHTLSGLSVQLETTKAYLDVPDTARQLIDQSLELTRSGSGNPPGIKGASRQSAG